jgi:hypothetical protein
LHLSLEWTTTAEWSFSSIFPRCSIHSRSNRSSIRSKSIHSRRCSACALLGGLLGWERGRADKPVGIRTMLPISAGASAFALLGEQIIDASSRTDII